jgi:outer membrane protein
MRIRHAFLLLSFLIPGNTFAQTTAPEPQQKIGHADWEYIFKRLPQYKQIENELKTFESQLQNQLKTKSEELERKYKIFQGLPANTPEPIRQDKASELSYLQGNMEKFQQDAQQSMQKKQNELVAPVFAKVGKAIEDVAVENGYAYIINPQMVGGGDVLLYANEKYNISDLVLSKLGVTTAR